MEISVDAEFEIYRNILILHSEFLQCEEHIRISQVGAEHHGDAFAAETRNIKAKLLHRLAIDMPVQEDLTWICAAVQQSADLAKCLAKAEIRFLEVHATVGICRAEDRISSAFALDVNSVTGLHIDIFRRIIDDRLEERGFLAAAALDRHVAFHA